MKDRPLNGFKHALLPGLHRYAARIGCVDVGYLVKGGIGTIVVHRYTVEHIGTGFPCPELGQLIPKIDKGILHLFFGNIHY